MNRFGNISSQSRMGGKPSAEQLLEKAFKLFTEGKLEQARDCCLTVIKMKPGFIQGHFLLGLVAQESRQWKSAISAYGMVVAINKKHVAAWAQLALLFAKVSQYDKSERALGEALSLKSKDPNVLNLIGCTYQEMGDEDKAKPYFAEAVKIAPDNLEFTVKKAYNHVFLGEKEEAEKIFLKLIDKNPNHASAQFSLSNLNKATDDKRIKMLKKIREKASQTPAYYSFINYAIGKECEDLEMWDDAFDAIEKGAKAKRSILEFNEQKDEIDLFDALKQTFTKEWLQNCGEGVDDSAPIFVLGQPRTGTTLVQRIISAHSKVESLGELGHFPISVKHLGGTLSSVSFTPDVVRAAANIDVKEIGNRYLNIIPNRTKGIDHFIDKLPSNFLYIPLIAAAFPNAKIVHLKRNPMDSCFSNYKQHFNKAFAYTYDQEEIARHHIRYRDLMDTWRSLLPGRIFDVEYENLVSDMEPNTKDLISFLGLEWEDDCLNFYKQSGSVKTASAAQVREKAHTKSVDRWKQYEKQLQPMYAILKDADLVD